MHEKSLGMRNLKILRWHENFVHEKYNFQFLCMEFFISRHESEDFASRNSWCEFFAPEIFRENLAVQYFVLVIRIHENIGGIFMHGNESRHA